VTERALSKFFLLMLCSAEDFMSFYEAKDNHNTLPRDGSEYNYQDF
jgi:hypothetical protein